MEFKGVYIPDGVPVLVLLSCIVAISLSMCVSNVRTLVFLAESATNCTTHKSIC